jgi:hypothetical protein
MMNWSEVAIVAIEGSTVAFGASLAFARWCLKRDEELDAPNEWASGARGRALAGEARAALKGRAMKLARQIDGLGMSEVHVSIRY